MEMSPITGDLPEMDARRDRPGHDVVARRVLAVEHIWQHDYVLALLGLRTRRLRSCRPKSTLRQEHGPLPLVFRIICGLVHFFIPIRYYNQNIKC